MADKPRLLEPIRRAAAVTDHVVVAFSAGKDSLAALDLACDHFAKVDAFWMYMVPGLSFQERYLGYIERRFKISILRIPHWSLARDFAAHHYRFGSVSADKLHPTRVQINDCWRSMRERFQCEWILTGEKRIDNFRRLVMAAQDWVEGIDQKRKTLNPLAWWSDKDVWAWLKRKRIPTPPDYGMFRQSFALFDHPQSMVTVAEKYPADFARIEKQFPFARAVVEREKIVKLNGKKTEAENPGS